MIYRKWMAAGAWVAMCLALGANARASEGTPAAITGLTLVGLAKLDGVAYASLVNVRTGEHFLPSSRAADGGIELVAVTGGEDAIIRQNGQSVQLRLGYAHGTAPVDVPPEVPTAGVNSPQADADAAALVPPPGRKLPLAFQMGDLSKLNLTDDQKAGLLRLRRNFVAAIGGGSGSSAGVTPVAEGSPGGGNSAPASSPSPSHTQVWQTAQEQSDAEFVMQFGTETFNLVQMDLAPNP